jgi:putative membrane protein
MAAKPPDPRFSLANERTFLAWNRTALALIGGGLAAAQVLKSPVGGARLSVGLALIAFGAAVAVAGLARWRARESSLRAHRPVPRSRVGPALVGLGTGALAVLAIVLVAIGQAQR